MVAVSCNPYEESKEHGRPQVAKKSPVGSFLVFGSQRLEMSTVVEAAALRKGVFILTRTGIAAALTACGGSSASTSTAPAASGSTAAAPSGDTIKIEFTPEYEIGGAKHYRDNTYASVAIAQVQDQEWKTVWPFEFASSKIQEVTLG